MRIPHTVSSALFLAILLATPVLAFAQQASATAISGSAAAASSTPKFYTTTGEQISPDEAPPAGSINCFDHYRFGSVQAELQASTDSAAAGTSIHFSGTIENANAYPITDGTLYVRVVRESDGTSPDTGEVIDQFPAMQHVLLLAKKGVPLSFDWKVPGYLSSGKYVIGTYFVSSNKYYLLGLPFADALNGNSTEFSVSGQQEGKVIFRKVRNDLLVDEVPYNLTAGVQLVDEKKPIRITATLLNDTTTDEIVPVHFSLYRWDQQDPANLIASSDDNIPVKAGKTASLSYVVADSSSAVYLLVATAKYHDVSSVLNVRLVRRNVPTIKLNFPAVSAYPLTAGKPTTLFSCLNSVGTLDRVEDNTLTLTLKDPSGAVIHSYTYMGTVTGVMMGVKDDFTPDKTYTSFTLEAELKHDGQVVDSATIAYDCTDLDPGSCQSGASGLLSFGTGTIPPALLIIALLVVVGFAGVSVWRLKRPSQSTTPMP